MSKIEGLPEHSQPSGGATPKNAATEALLPSAVLSAAADLIEPEGAWTQGTWARDASGDQTADEKAPDAVCWCAVAALWVAQPSGPRIPRRYLARALNVTPGGGLVDWNDNPERKQAEVVAALRAASELASSEGQ